MNASGISRSKIIAAIVVAHLVVAAFCYSIVFPIAANMGAGPVRLPDLRLYYTLIGFVASVAVSLAATLGAVHLQRHRGGFMETAEHLREPFLLLDENNRYLGFNREAGRILSLSGDGDIGRPVDSTIASALRADADATDALDPQYLLERNGRYYRVVDNPLPGMDASSAGRRRVVMLRDVSSQMRLREAFGEISATMAVLNANTAKISSSASFLSRGAAQQAGSLSSIAASLDEFSKKIQGNTESAVKSTQLAAQAREAAERSGGEIANALSAMTDVQDAGIRIARIVKLIDDIAFQTNLLALNAAVEAARAGRQGKGFAVVADEVRNLAGRSAKAAKDTATMVEDVTERIGNASAYISRLEEMLGKIVHDAIRMADSSASSSATSDEQASAIMQVNREVGQVSAVTNNTLSAAEETEAAAGILARQMDTLKKRLGELGGEFALAPVDGRVSRINLEDEPDRLLRSSQTGFSPNEDYAQGHLGYEGYSAPSHGRAASNEWNLNPDDDPDSLSHLLRSDGYEHDSLQELLASANNKPVFGHDEPTEYTTSPDGDRVIRPGQNIQLDDAEFGRY